MSVRPDLPAGDAPEAQNSVADRPAPGLTIAIAIAVGGAVLAALGPVLGVVNPPLPPGFLSWPLLLVLALLPPVIAALFARRKSAVAAKAVLLGPAVLAVGRLGVDWQVLINAEWVARPELFLPHTLDVLTPGPGLWLLFAGHVAVIAAGLLAVLAGRTPDSAETDTEGRRQGLLAWVLCAAVLGAVGISMAPFTSGDPYLLPRAAVDAPPAILVGTLLIALAVPTVGGFVASASDPEFSRGGLLGLAAAVAGVVVPPLFAPMLLSPVHFTWGPALGLIAALALAALAFPAGRRIAATEADDLRLPALTRLLTIGAVLAVVAGVLAMIAAVTPQYAMPDGMPEPTLYQARMFWPAGAIVVLSGAGLITRRALALRPVLAAAWVVIPLVAAAVLDTVLTAVQSAGAHAGIGAWLTGLAVLLAVAAAVVCELAGAVERDDVDLSAISARRLLLVPAAFAGVLAFAAFALPAVNAPGYTEPGVFTEFETTSWGLVLALVVVLVSVGLAPLCRPARGSALFVGAALILVVRVLQFPLTIGRIPGSTVGSGVWCGLACIAVLAVAAVLAARTGAEKG